MTGQCDGVGALPGVHLHRLTIVSRSPAEVAVAIAAEIVASKRRPAAARQDLVRVEGGGRVD